MEIIKNEMRKPTHDRIVHCGDHTRLYRINGSQVRARTLLTVAADIFMGAALNADAVPTNAAARMTLVFTMVLA